MYCSKCGAAMADGAAFCSNCGQGFPVAVAARAPILSASVAAPMEGGAAAIPAHAGYAAVPRVEYAGFWLRFLAFLIDNVVMGIAFVLILIPLIFLTGLGGFIGTIHPDEDFNDVGIFMLIGLIFLAATVSLVFTWLYWSSRTWRGSASASGVRRRGTLPKSSPTWCLHLSDTSWRGSRRRSRRCTTCWRDAWCCGATVEETATSWALCTSRNEHRQYRDPTRSF